MGRYKSTSRDTLAERHFPVRLRVAIPPDGFGPRLAAMIGWLDRRFGKSGYWQGTGSRTYQAENLFFYFLTLDAAQAFMAEFGCSLCSAGEWPDFTPMRQGDPRRWSQ